MASSEPTVVDAHLDMDPANALEFVLQKEEATPKCTLTLQHPDADSAPIAFKVKTTQPRRYLVRPNQGLIQPGKSEKIQILMVEKDKTQLLASYESLGAAALDHCKDKFLVQSVAVTPTEAAALTEYDQLTALWTRMQGSGSSSTANKKLHVQHTVAGAAASSARSKSVGSSPPSAPAAVVNPESLSKEQLVVEMGSLRRKYDELVSFSVNLTAERDILNNTLEQTKRDLNRELAAKRSSGGEAYGVPGGPKKAAGGSVFSTTTVMLLLLALLAGAKLQQMGLLAKVPVLGGQFSEGGGDDTYSEL